MFKNKDERRTLLPSKVDATTNRVHLQNLWGLSPRTYVPLLYAIVLALVLILLAVNSLLINKGEKLVLVSVPAGAAVTIDGNYVGATPMTKIQKKGSYALKISLPYFHAYEETVHTNNSLFKNLGAQRIKVTLAPQVDEKYGVFIDENSEFTRENEPSAPDLAVAHSLVAYTIQELASWNTTNTQTSRYLNAPVLAHSLAQMHSLLKESRLKKNSRVQGIPINFVVDTLLALLYESMPYVSTIEVNTKNNTKDKPKNHAQNEQFATWSKYYRELLGSDEFEAFRKEHKDRAGFEKKLALLERFYSDKTESGSDARASNWTLDSTNSSGALSAPLTPANLSLLGIQFSYIAAKKLIYYTSTLTNRNIFSPIKTYMEYADNASTVGIADTTPTLTINTQEFYIMNQEITQSQFAQFLADRNISIDEWKATKLSLVSEEHKENYFRDYNPAKYPNRSLRFITWYDAQSYALWFSKKIASSGLHAKLPNEYEWNAATLDYPQSNVMAMPLDYVPQNSPANTPLLRGTLWEWGDSWYSTSPQYAAYSGPKYGSEKHVFGGSFASKKELTLEGVPLYISRNNAMLPNWAQAYTGFRLVLVRL